MKHILLPTDFSENARNAAVYAVKLFGTKDVQYYLLNTYVEPNMGTGAVISMKDYMKENAVEELNKDLKYIQERIGDDLAVIETFAEHGGLQKVIDRMSKKIPFDYVVMGTQGETAGRWMMGSVSRNTIQASKIPVIVVPEEAAFEKVENIVYATNLDEDESFLINKLVEFAKMHDAVLTILHIDEDVSSQRWSIEALKDVIGGIAYPKVNFVDLVNRDVEEAIIHFTEENDTDVLAITTYTTTLMKKLFHKSMAKQLLLHTHIPLLVFNRKEYDKYFLG